MPRSGLNEFIYNLDQKLVQLDVSIVPLLPHNYSFGVNVRYLDSFSLNLKLLPPALVA
jgi:hypothetical protein